MAETGLSIVDGCEVSWVENSTRVGAERVRLWVGTGHLQPCHWSYKLIDGTCIDIGQRTEVGRFVLVPVMDTGCWLSL